jgi:hypothetical protein
MGAEPFHGPVRDGKGWVQLAMGVKLKRVTSRLVFLWPTRVGRSLLCEQGFSCMSRSPPMRGASCRGVDLAVSATVLMCVNYRIKPYE